MKAVQFGQVTGASPIFSRAFACLLLAGIVGEGHGATPGWEPAKPVEIIVSVRPGSAHDVTARIVQKILRDRKIVTMPIVVMNKPGGGHTIAWNYVNQNGEDGYTLLVAAITMLTNKISGKSALTYGDFTPITQLLNEYVAVAVGKDSPLATGTDMVNQLKSDPRSLSIAIGSAVGNGPHLALSLAMKQGGVSIREMKTVVFPGGSASTLAVLGGHVDAVATLASNVLPFVKSGKLRVIAVSSPRRLGGAFAEVPTWKEQGIDSVFSNFRFMLGTKGMDAAQVAHWERSLLKLSETSEWKQYLEKYNLEAAPMGGKACESFLKNETSRLQVVMTELGLNK